MTERDEACHAGQQVEPERARDRDEDKSQKRQDIGVDVEGRGDQRHNQNGRPGPDKPRIREDDEIGVGFLVIAAAHQTLTISRSPNRPNGWTIRTIMIIRKPATSFMPEPR